MMVSGSVSIDVPDHPCRCRIDCGDVAVAAGVFGEGDRGMTVTPGEHAGEAAGRASGLAAAACGHQVDVATGRTLVAHQAANEGDLFAVGREAGHRDLQAMQGPGARAPDA